MVLNTSNILIIVLPKYVFLGKSHNIIKYELYLFVYLSSISVLLRSLFPIKNAFVLLPSLNLYINKSQGITRNLDLISQNIFFFFFFSLVEYSGCSGHRKKTKQKKTYVLKYIILKKNTLPNAETLVSLN